MEYSSIIMVVVEYNTAGTVEDFFSREVVVELKIIKCRGIKLKRRGGTGT